METQRRKRPGQPPSVKELEELKELFKHHIDVLMFVLDFVFYSGWIILRYFHHKRIDLRRRQLEHCFHLNVDKQKFLIRGACIWMFAFSGMAELL
ncbi:hypothetical protein F383_25279 [Gossypium arboreum]|uniref:Uncharacterized protein n=1 Tax=Gossypium arboreum TaxID=29729 RepID=A0A0B0NY40_GOSAR|nr:hypothetical protein F383_25279 [Gossypium arboreum]